MNVINYFRWVIANILGAALGSAIAFTVISPMQSGNTFTRDLLQVGAIMGVAIGVAQWLVLFRWRRGALWILATAVGWAIGLSIYRPIFSFLSDFFAWTRSVIAIPLAFTLAAFTIGGVIGLCQWLILRNWVKKSHLWILINLWAIGVSFFIAAIALYYHRNPPAIFLIIFLSIFGLIKGMITGEVLLKLLRHPKTIS